MSPRNQTIDGKKKEEAKNKLKFSFSFIFFDVSILIALKVSIDFNAAKCMGKRITVHAAKRR